MPTPAPPESICIVRLSHIGDTCHALAVARAIQDTWPETALTWIIGKTEAGLLGDIPGIEFIIFDKSAGRKAYAEVQKALAGRTFDVALCLHASMRVNRLYRMIAARIKLGYDYRRARDLQWLFTNQRIPAVDGQHVLDGMLSFATELGVPPRPPRWDIPLTDAHREFAAQQLDGAAKTLLISPCSSARLRNYRNWSAENYAAAANHARQKFGCRILVTGGRSDEEAEYGRVIARLTGHEAVNLVGKTSLKQLQALIAAADAVLCPDSGPAHMATAAGTPVIGLYATSDPARSGPYFHRELTVNAYPLATGRFLGKTPAELRFGRRVRDPRAMGLIRLRDVNAKIDAVFGK